ncbi:hypothetical protein IGB42_02380 [Andreprevotia sp. IGB-42]|uniref:hypothetical protein n=1 Tax=Andreprevotia sp. IGB-42 TaxID=2497473 RepID=UPI00135B652A|nr:hypothetical protein [Andreprevotia sp. IGB-42]KAF0812984.1 hypothetical protein IGB42_02380 [Andreprevotia sp. IGB-42]
MNRQRLIPRGQTLLLLAWVLLLGFFFANVEIQIEGAGGWAANLPTWRVEKHWLLDIFWGGRAMTGYHAWVFPFIGLFFHLPVFFSCQWSWRIEARIVACIMLFWISEDYLWFVLNPAYGIAHFSPEFVPWHKHWIAFAPTDYWTMTAVALVLLFVSGKPSDKSAASSPQP